MFRKTALLVIFIAVVLTPVCFANDNEVRMDSIKGVALLDKLSVSNGEGEYTGYLKLNGYPWEDKFQIYYQDNSHDSIISFHVTYADLRGFNLDELWDFSMPNGTPMRISRRQAYNIFLSYGGTPAEKYISEVFPGAYDDWLASMVFSQDATRLVERYLKKKHGIKTVNRYTTADVKIESSSTKDRDATTLDGMVRH